MVIMPSFTGGLPASARLSISQRNLAVKAASPRSQDAAKIAYDANEKKESHCRRAMVFAAVTAVVGIVGQTIVTAGEEPKPRTVAAKKLYGPVCVTMPTASICRK